MAGTKEGGLKAAQKNRERYGEDWYSRIGRVGGKNGHTGGFASMPKEKVQEAGRKGGKISKRGPAKHPHLSDEEVAIRKEEERRRLRKEIKRLQQSEEEW